MNILDKTSDDGYLRRLSDPLLGGEDKFEIGRYLQSQGAFNILEIGPGAGQTLEKSIALSSGLHREDEYFVLDLDRSILDRLEAMPAVKQWGKVKFVKGNALEMPFPGNKFDLINLSAVAHECASYWGGVDAIRKLASECSRVLKEKGILLFRDLEGTELQRRQKCRISGLPARAFVHLFLPRFLDREFTRTSKPVLYDRAFIDLEVGGMRYSYKDYFSKTMSPDMAESLSVDGPAGFIKEIQRHFLTFVDAFAPELFYDATETFDGSDVILHFEKDSSVQGLLRFCVDSGVRVFPHSSRIYRISQEGFLAFRKSIQAKFERLAAPVRIGVGLDEAESLRSALKCAPFRFNEETQEDGRAFLLPAGVALCLDEVLTKLGVDLASIGKEVLSWSRREGEEYYFYSDFSSLLSEFIKSSIRLEEACSASFSGYACLVPTESTYVPRRKYIEILRSQFAVEGEEGISQCVEGKRIIHFCKLPIEIGFKKIVDFCYGSSDFLDRQKVTDLVHHLEKHIRDFVSRSFDFNKQIQAELRSSMFAKDLVELEDSLDGISQSDKVIRLLGKSMILVGRIATRKEPYRLFLEERGYATFKLTDFLLQDVKTPRPTRRDLFLASEKARVQFGDEVLAKRAAEAIKASGRPMFLVLGCRSPSEIAFLKKEFPEAIVVGLFPSTEELTRILIQRYPDVSKANIEKWIGWNDGRESDGHTNIEMCYELCDVLFPENN